MRTCPAAELYAATPGSVAFSYSGVICAVKLSKLSNSGVPLTPGSLMPEYTDTRALL